MKILKLAKYLELDFDQSIDSLINELNDLKKTFEDKGFSDLTIKKEYPGYDGGYELQLHGYTEETEQEKKARLKKEVEQKIKEPPMEVE